MIENFEAVNSTDEDEDSLKKGEIRVVWHPDGKEEIVAETNVSTDNCNLPFLLSLELLINNYRQIKLCNFIVCGCCQVFHCFLFMTYYRLVLLIVH